MINIESRGVSGAEKENGQILKPEHKIAKIG